MNFTISSYFRARYTIYMESDIANLQRSIDELRREMNTRFEELGGAPTITPQFLQSSTLSTMYLACEACRWAGSSYSRGNPCTTKPSDDYRKIPSSVSGENLASSSALAITSYTDYFFSSARKSRQKMPPLVRHSALSLVKDRHSFTCGTCQWYFWLQTVLVKEVCF